MHFESKFEGPWVDSEGLQLRILPVADWRWQRPVTERGKCCQCGWCYLFCPTGCIVEKEGYFAANLDYCKGCGICARECPVNAIMMVREEM